jgi:hypothetical protein
MSRHGYIEFDGDDPLAEGRWRGALKSAIRGKRGQSFLEELIQALDAMPEKALASHSFTRDGEICALGAVAVKRGIDVSEFEPGDDEDEWDDEINHDALGAKFGIASILAREIMFENDDCDQWHWEDDGSVCEGVRHGETRKHRTHELPTERWQRMRDWAVRCLRGQSNPGVKE